MAEEYTAQSTDNQKTKTKKGKKGKSPSFGKIMLASGLGTLIVLMLVGLFKLMVFFGLVASINSEGSAQIKPDTFLRVDLTKAMSERSRESLEAMFGSGSDMGFVDLQRQLAYAAGDKNVSGLLLYMGSSFPFSWGNSAELRQAILDFRTSGKPVYVYADQYTLQGYFVASAADSIFLNPAGMVEFSGIGTEALFFKEALDKLSVNITLIRPRNNSFKSAGETYTMNHLSDANRQQIREYINDIWDYVTSQVSQSRHISQQELNTIADNLSAYLANDALQQKLVDRLCFEADIKAAIKSQYKNSNTMGLGQYAKSHTLSHKAKDKIAILYAEGDVKYGTGYDNNIYSDKLTKNLDEVADDDNVKAIVLRINSPGGMVTASEIMTNAVARAAAKKPLIVSMGNVAASAGYEMSCNATAIVAEPTTITGSIGVFATIPELGGAMRRHLGVTTDTVKTNTNAVALTAMRPLSPDATELLQRNVEEFYITFISRVAKGRGLSTEFVDSIARGRVWTGREALKLGLVDQLGGLNDAVKLAADKAGISSYDAYDYPASESLFMELLNQRDDMQSWMKATNGSPLPTSRLVPHAGDGVWVPASAAIEFIKKICQTQGLQARIEFLLVD